MQTFMSVALLIALATVAVASLLYAFLSSASFGDDYQAMRIDAYVTTETKLKFFTFYTVTKEVVNYKLSCPGPANATAVYVDVINPATGRTRTVKFDVSGDGFDRVIVGGNFWVKYFASVDIGDPQLCPGEGSYKHSLLLTYEATTGPVEFKTVTLVLVDEDGAYRYVTIDVSNPMKYR